jgi:hypothetical protein
MAIPSSETPQTAEPAPHSADPEWADPDWMTFPGGELEGKRPRALCRACRERHHRAATQAVTSAQAALKLICFHCYRAELERDRALRAAGQLDTASEARFQCTLPFDRVNTARLTVLKAARAADRQARGASQAIERPPGVSQAIERPPGVGQAIERCVDRRRQAQIAARHALRAIGDGLRMQQVHAADLQLPEAWLPFVVSR